MNVDFILSRLLWIYVIVGACCAQRQPPFSPSSGNQPPVAAQHRPSIEILSPKNDQVLDSNSVQAVLRLKGISPRSGPIPTHDSYMCLKLTYDVSVVEKCFEEIDTIYSLSNLPPGLTYHLQFILFDHGQAVAHSMRTFRIVGIRNPLNRHEVLTIESAIQTAIALTAKGLEDQAMEIVRTVLSESPRNAEALHMMGASFFANGDSDKAVEYVERGLRHLTTKPTTDDYDYNNHNQSHNFAVHNTLGSCYKAMGRTDEAEHQFRSALAVDPSNPFSQHNLAMVLQSENRLEEALTLFRSVLTSTLPELLSSSIVTDAAMRTCDILALLFRVQDSLICWEEAIQRFPSYGPFYREEGLLLMQYFRYDLARLRLEKAVEYGEKTILANLGTACEQAGDYHAAREYIEEAIVHAMASNVSYDHLIILNASLLPVIVSSREEIRAIRLEMITQLTYLINSVNTSELSPISHCYYTGHSLLYHDETNNKEMKVALAKLYLAHMPSLKTGRYLAMTTNSHSYDSSNHDNSGSSSSHSRVYYFQATNKKGTAPGVAGLQQQQQVLVNLSSSSSFDEHAINDDSDSNSTGNNSSSILYYNRHKLMQHQQRRLPRRKSPLETLHYSLTDSDTVDTDDDDGTSSKLLTPSPPPSTDVINENETVMAIAKDQEPISEQEEEEEEFTITRPIRITFISRYFYHRPEGLLSAGLIELLSGGAGLSFAGHEMLSKWFDTQVILITGGPQMMTHDHLQRRIMNVASHSYSLIDVDRNLNLLGDTLRYIQPDIIIYPEISQDPVSYFTAFTRYAPVQAAWLAHPDTTGIPNIDYFLSSEHEASDADHLYSERLHRFHNFGTIFIDFYAARAQMMIQSPRTVLLNRFKLYDGYSMPKTAHSYLVASGGLSRLHPDFDYILHKILTKDKQAYIIILDIGAVAEGVQKMLRARFYKRLTEEQLERVRFVNTPNPLNATALIQTGHVILDSYPANGMFEYSLQALAMGIPVITMPHPKRMAGRMTYALYKMLDYGLEKTHSDPNYIPSASIEETGDSDSDSASSSSSSSGKHHDSGKLYCRLVVDSPQEYFEAALKIAHDPKIRDYHMQQLLQRRERLFTAHLDRLAEEWRHFAFTALRNATIASRRRDRTNNKQQLKVQQRDLLAT